MPSVAQGDSFYYLRNDFQSDGYGILGSQVSSAHGRYDVPTWSQNNPAPPFEFQTPDLGKTFSFDALIGADRPVLPEIPIQTFKMRGWYVIGGVYEVWTSTGTPNLTPPSGHTLLDIVIVF